MSTIEKLISAETYLHQTEYTKVLFSDLGSRPDRRLFRPFAYSTAETGTLWSMIALYPAERCMADARCVSFIRLFLR
jgi:hypothetical protein